MAKVSSNRISFSSLKKKLSGNQTPACLIINTAERTLFDELICELGKKFIGDGFNDTDNVKWFYTDDKNMEAVLTECSNSSFFVEKKIVVLKIVKRPGYRGFTKQENETFSNYLKTPNPDTKLIILDESEEFKPAQYDELESAGAKIFEVERMEQNEFVNWLKDQFSYYEIDDNVIQYFCGFLNTSVDEAKEEVEKLKIFSFDSKKITKEDVNLCIGIAKDFSEVDFVQAVLSKDPDLAFRIFKSVSLKKDFATYALYLLSSAYTAIAKLRDPSSASLNPYELRTALKIWSDSDRYLQIYKQAVNGMNELKIKVAFDYIYEAESKLKSLDIDSEILISKLINNLVRL